MFFLKAESFSTSELFIIQLLMGKLSIKESNLTENNFIQNSRHSCKKFLWLYSDILCYCFIDILHNYVVIYRFVTILMSWDELENWKEFLRLNVRMMMRKGFHAIKPQQLPEFEDRPTV